MAKKKRKKVKNPAWKHVRRGVSNINQKHLIFADKRTKRKKTRQSKKTRAVEESNDGE